MLADNKTGKCCKCGHAVQFRPHAPQHCVVSCVGCALPLMADAAGKGELKPSSPGKSAAEISVMASEGGGKA